MGSLRRLLRSRRVALWLIASVSAYVGIVTLVPQQAVDPEKHARWSQSGGAVVDVARALGADHAYTSPLFLALAFALALSTSACAWERSARALRTWRARGAVSERVLDRINHRPDVHLVTPLGQEEATSQAAEALRRIGMKVRRGPSLIYAERGAWGLAGSPVFHWSMVMLVAIIALGQLTRWEGLLGVSETGPVTEEPTIYRRLDEGPLALPHTGWTISLTSVRERMRIGDVEYGVTPRIALADGERTLAEQDVYPNNPLRHGPLLVHLSDHGLAVRIEAIGPDGTLRGSDDRLIDFSDEATSGTIPSEFQVADDEGEPIADVAVWVNARDRRGALPRLKPPGEVVFVEVTGRDGASRLTTPAVGTSVDLGDGWTLAIRDFGYYARLSVVRDWSVAWIYVLLGVMTAGAAVALLVPYRCVWLAVQPEADGASAVRAGVTHYRRDPLFADVVRGALSEVGGFDGRTPESDETRGVE